MDPLALVDDAQHGLDQAPSVTKLSRRHRHLAASRDHILYDSSRSDLRALGELCRAMRLRLLANKATGMPVANEMAVATGTPPSPSPASTSVCRGTKPAACRATSPGSSGSASKRWLSK
jgi:hypothetical protein